LVDINEENKKNKITLGSTESNFFSIRDTTIRGMLFTNAQLVFRSNLTTSIALAVLLFLRTDDKSE